MLHSKGYSIVRTLGERIRRRLAAAGYTPADWAAALKTTPSYCYQILNGHHWLNIKRLMSTAVFLQMSTDDLLIADEDFHLVIAIHPEDTSEEILQRVQEQLESYFKERSAAPQPSITAPISS